MVQNQGVSPAYIGGRGKDFCRGCQGRDLFSALDLGELPIANELLASNEIETELFPLHLRVCRDCGLGQVADVVTPERIFKDYRYLSSISTTFLEHAENYVRDVVNEDMFAPGDWVLEIASNDGYLLKNFLKLGIKTLGVEPADNVAAISSALGIDTISEFFSTALAIEIVQKHGHPKLIVANNVLAHVPDLADFLKGLAVLCGKETKISIENPSLANILVDMQFDTIYHEHYSYLSAFSVQRLGAMHGLHLNRVEELAVHGGSTRFWLSISNWNDLTEPSVDEMIKHELKIGLFDSNQWDFYSVRVNEILENFLSWLRRTKESDGRVYGYGAAAKASTILNSIEVGADLISAIADASLEKQGRFMPSHGIKIISPKTLFSAEPTDVVVFPWNIKHEIASYLRLNLGSQTRLWCAIPQMHEIEIY
jgi:hypothetical protein